MIGWFVAAAWAGSRQDLTEQLERLQDDPFLARATLGTVVQDVRTGEAYFSRNGDKLLAPASTVKLATAAAALETLGPERRFSTRLGAAGPIDGKTLRGALVWVGGGDPTFGDGDPLAAVGALADAVKARGIEQIEGDIVADDRLFSWHPLGDGWSWDDALWKSGAPVAGINLGHNLATFTVRPGTAVGTSAQVTWDALESCVPLDFSVQTAPAGVPDALAVDRPPGSSVTALWGSIPLDAAPRRLTVTLPDPPSCAADVLRQALVARGVQVVGGARRARRDEAMNLETIHETRSAPLREILVETLKESDNLYAEAIWRSLDPVTVGKSPAGSARVVADTLRAAGVPDDGMVLLDGSGLSRKDLLTPESLVRLLRWAWDRPWRDAWLAGFPVAAADGTLKRRMVGGPAAGQVHAKTGTLANVFNLAGYVESKDGRMLAFAFLSNAVVTTGAAARLPQDTALEVLSDTDFSKIVAPPKSGKTARPPRRHR